MSEFPHIIEEGTIESVVRLFEENDVEEFVMADDLYNLYSNIWESTDKKKIYINNDARSAAFYCLGKTIKTKKYSVLFIHELFLPHALTVLVEAQLQKVPLVIVLIKQKDGVKDNFEYIKKYVHLGNESWLVSNENSLGKYFSKYPKPRGNETLIIRPFISETVSIVDNYKSSILKAYDIVNKNCRNHIIHIADQYLDYINQHNRENKVVLYQKDNKYGLISKFMGYSYSSDADNYLITSQDYVTLDINSFKIFHKNKNIKIIFISIEKSGFENWFKANGFDYFYKESSDIDFYEEIRKNEKPVVIEINGGNIHV